MKYLKVTERYTLLYVNRMQEILLVRVDGHSEIADVSLILPANGTVYIANESLGIEKLG